MAGERFRCARTDERVQARVRRDDPTGRGHDPSGGARPARDLDPSRSASHSAVAAERVPAAIAGRDRHRPDRRTERPAAEARCIVDELDHLSERSRGEALRRPPAGLGHGPQGVRSSADPARVNARSRGRPPTPRRTARRSTVAGRVHLPRAGRPPVGLCPSARPRPPGSSHAPPAAQTAVREARARTRRESYPICNVTTRAPRTAGGCRPVEAPSTAIEVIHGGENDGAPAGSARRRVLAELPAGTRAQWDSTAKAVTCLVCTGGAVDPSRPAAVATDAAVLPPIDVGDPGRSACVEVRATACEAPSEDRAEVGHRQDGQGRQVPVRRSADDDGPGRRQHPARSGSRRSSTIASATRRCCCTTGRCAAPGATSITSSSPRAACGSSMPRRSTTARSRSATSAAGSTSDVRLYVGGRDRTKKVTGLGWQVEAVTRALAAEQAPIHPGVELRRCGVAALLRQAAAAARRVDQLADEARRAHRRRGPTGTRRHRSDRQDPLRRAALQVVAGQRCAGW